jgi:hypothetical protein
MVHSGSLLRRLGFMRKRPQDEEGMLQESLLPGLPRQSGLSENGADYQDCYDMTQLTLHGAHSRAKRAWLFFDAAGGANLREVRRPHQAPEEAVRHGKSTPAGVRCLLLNHIACLRWRSTRW